MFRRRRFFTDDRCDAAESNPPDIDWFTPDGAVMTDEDWDSGFGRAVAMFLNGQGIPDRSTRGERVVDDSFLLCFNAHDEAIEFLLPAQEWAPGWSVVLDTHRPDLDAEEALAAEATLKVPGRSVVVLQAQGDDPDRPVQQSRTDLSG